ncbi:MAG: PTS sugar transporter subunit IIA [Spirochaetales bacterium]|nr:PTS sugar transporter subunit IIA [Spirochaetales bacterium]
MKNNSKKTRKIDEDIMTLSELAGYLKISEETLHRMADQGEIPVTTVANQQRFIRTVIDDWLMSRMTMASKTTLVKLSEEGTIILPLSRLIQPELVVLDLKPGTKKDILIQLIEPLIRSGRIKERETLLSLLLEREDMVSTAISRGVAIPHPRNPEDCPVAEPCIVFGLCREGTDFNSLDGEKTHIFFLICTPSELIHLKILAKLAMLIRNREVVFRLRNVKSIKEILTNIITIDQEIFAINKWKDNL